jgi:hypothetical protein
MVATAALVVTLISAASNAVPPSIPEKISHAPLTATMVAQVNRGKSPNQAIDWAEVEL